MDLYAEAIARLNSYDLSKFPYEEIKEDIGLLAKFGCMSMVLHKGKSMTRARLADAESPFLTREALQYVPAKRNNRYARASSPYNTMFYASVVPNTDNGTDFDSSVPTATVEISQLHKPNSTVEVGEEKITYSKWVVTKDIPLLAMCYYKDFIDRSPHTLELYKAFQKALDSTSPELVKKSLEVTDFLAHHFAKSNSEEKEEEYLISAAFTEMAVKKGIGGIYYPSVKVEGRGFNVAIHPKFVDECLTLVEASEATIYKYHDQFFVEHDTLAEVKDDSIPFEYLPNPKREGRDKAMDYMINEMK